MSSKGKSGGKTEKQEKEEAMEDSNKVLKEDRNAMRKQGKWKSVERRMTHINREIYFSHYATVNWTK